MRKPTLPTLALALLLSILASGADGQTVSSSQIALKSGGGLVGSAGQLAVGVTRATSAPSGPVTGQLWCDTNATPCVLKVYNGSTWDVSPGASTVTIAANATTFPANPVDGQLFISKNPRRLYYYDATAAAWFGTPTNWQATGATYNADFSATPLTPPASAPVATGSGTGGSIAAGSYAYVVTFRNSTGGETTPGPASNVVTTTGSTSSISLASIPLGPDGTTSRGIYRSKTTFGLTGPYYWVATVNDNTTTTLASDGLADASLVLPAPDKNFSGALPAGWTATNTSASTTSGGCGLTASASLVCKTSNTLSSLGTQSTDSNVRASYSIAAYSAGDYTIQWRVVGLSQAGTLAVTCSKNPFGGLRVGTSDSAARTWITSALTNSQLSGANVLTLTDYNRTAASGNANVTSTNAAFPLATSYPFYVRAVRRSGYITYFISPDGVTWSNVLANPTHTLAANSSAAGANEMTTWELPMGHNGVTTAALVEIDSFSITVP